eukprot:TRINITY_DN11832_c0_g1_i2.p1 TRINITY_DN11832_c0_g1~~TRINITY_DN11832_c0_g1_i2.p1  ORF type:complete len:800 (-),score=207.54 TRINITY_DN11832_c0_g1_i2:119-2518(-)
MAPLSCLGGCGGSSSGGGRGVSSPSAADALTEEKQWLEGGRYEVLQPIVLRSRPDVETAEITGRVRTRDAVLLMALQAVPCAEGGGERLLAYLANTKKTDWVSGWGQIEGPPLQDRALRRRRLRGSWQVGGRYRVLGSPVLRAEIELESHQLYEVRSDEEVLLLDIGLVLRGGEPRLRAYVRTDAGQLGWLTVELPGVAPLLEPLNLLSEEALAAKTSCLGLGSKRRPAARITPAGQNEAWEVGGKYRTLARAQLHEGPEFDSKIVAIAKKSSLLYVKRVQHVPRPQGDSQVRLQVAFETSKNDPNQAVYWCTPVDSAGELIVDTRDHLEYEKLLMNSQAIQSAPTSPGLLPAAWSEPFTVWIDKTTAPSLGLEVDHEDGQTLMIERILEGPFQDFNTKHTEDKVCVGDRIVSVNRCSGDAMAIIQELGKQIMLEIVLQRPAGKPFGDFSDLGMSLMEDAVADPGEEVLGPNFDQIQPQQLEDAAAAEVLIRRPTKQSTAGRSGSAIAGGGMPTAEFQEQATPGASCSDSVNPVEPQSPSLGDFAFVSRHLATVDSATSVRTATFGREEDVTVLGVERGLAFVEEEPTPMDCEAAEFHTEGGQGFDDEPIVSRSAPVQQPLEKAGSKADEAATNFWQAMRHRRVATPFCLGSEEAPEMRLFGESAACETDWLQGGECAPCRPCRPCRSGVQSATAAAGSLLGCGGPAQKTSSADKDKEAAADTSVAAPGALHGYMQQLFTSVSTAAQGFLRPAPAAAQLKEGSVEKCSASPPETDADVIDHGGDGGTGASIGSVGAGVC